MRDKPLAPNIISKRRWHIAGLGAVGALATANLTNSGFPVCPIKRTTSSKVISQFRTIDKRLITLPEGSVLSDCEEINNLFVPLKAFDVLPFLNACLDKLSPNANLVLCHNGMGTIEPAMALLPNFVNLYFCTTNNGAYKTDSEIVHAGTGDSFWKLIKQGNDDLLSSEDFEAMFDPCIESDDLNKVLWKKLLINCAINPLTAIHKVKNGQLSESQYQTTITSVVEEVCTLARFEEIELDVDLMKNLVNQVISKTAKNTSSMLQDIQNNKRTEIDYINGYIVGLAQKHGLNVEKNEELFQRVKEISA